MRNGLVKRIVSMTVTAAMLFTQLQLPVTAAESEQVESLLIQDKTVDDLEEEYKDENKEENKEKIKEENELTGSAIYPKNPWKDADGGITYDCIWFGNYYQEDTNGDGVADVKDVKQPIKWRVLSVSGNDAFLLADKNLDCKRYNENSVIISWKESTIRSWLNGYKASVNSYGEDYSLKGASFLDNAFTAAEKNAIIMYPLANNAGGKTNDKVFLLSYDDTVNQVFGFSSKTGIDKARIGINTAFAKKHGASEANSTSGVSKGAGVWWLRSRGDSMNKSEYVNGDGIVYSYANTYITANAVRPALHLNLTSSLWSSAGSVYLDGKTAGGVSSDKPSSGGESESSNDGEAAGNLDNISWSIKNNTLTLTGSGRVGDSTLSPSWYTYKDRIYKTVISEGITELGGRCLSGLSSMRSISLPLTLTKIDSTAFYNCKKIRRIDYNGNSSAWNQIDRGGIENNFKDSKTTLAFNDGSSKGYFEFVTFKGAADTFVSDYEWKDSWFFENSYNNYNHELAKLSLKTEMSAFGIRDFDAVGNKCTPDSKNITDMMDSMGFEYDSKSVNYPEYDPNNYETIGYAIGKKNITYNGQEETVILVALRGAGYGYEWGSNFNVGHDDMTLHAGFGIAAGTVKNALNDYLDSQDDLKENMKFWIVGYSRGGATANALASLIDDGNCDSHLKGHNRDLIAYTFETPLNTVQEDAHSSKYANIYNVINPADLIPMVPMKELGFTRYGITLYLPAETSNGKFESLYLRMMEEYLKICSVGRSEWIELFPYLKNKELIFSLLASKLGELVGTRQNYFKYLQDTAKVTAAESFCNSGDKDVVGTAINSLLRDVMIQLSVKDKNVTRATIMGVITALTALMHPNLVSSMVTGIYYMTDTKFGEYVEDSLGTLGATIATGHYPELQLAWMNSLSGGDLKSVYSYEKHILNCPIDVTVRNKDGEIVAQIIKDEVQDTGNIGLSCYVDVNGQKVVITPDDAEYVFDVKPYDDGVMTYTVEDIKQGETEPEKVTVYNELSLTENESYVINAVNGVSEIKNPQNETVSASMIITENVYRTVSVNATAGGSVYGGGNYIQGEYAKLTAVSENGFCFDGWYDESGVDFVSDEQEYRVMVSENVTYLAKFVPEATKTPAPTVTEAPTPTVTEAPTPTVTKAPMPTVTEEPMPTATKAPTPTVTKAPTPTVTKAPTPTVTEASMPTATKAPTSTVTKAPTPTVTKAPTPIVTKVPTPTATKAPTPTVTKVPESTFVPEIIKPVFTDGKKATYVKGDIVEIKISGVSKNAIEYKGKGGSYSKETGELTLTGKGSIKLFSVINGKKKNLATIKCVEPKMKNLKLKTGKSKVIKLKGFNNIVWISSDEKVAKVNGGTVSAVGAGTATITAYINGHPFTSTVNVVQSGK